MQNNFLKNGLDALVHQTLERWHVPGLALAVVSGDDVLHLAGYGQRDPSRGLPVTPDTLFPIASMTKSFAVMSFGLLVDEGKLEWDKPVRDYLPGWQMFDQVSTETLTVRDMLSHRSGLPSHDWIWWGSDFSRRDLLARLRHLEPNAPIRSRFQYNNVLYMLASLIVEEVAGVSWERFVQTRIFDELRMKRSNFSTRITQQDPDHARPHIYREGPLRECSFWEQDENSVTGAAGTINSCASELATWLTLQMNAGKVGRRQFVKPETLEAMHQPSIFIDDPQARRRFGYEFSSYGMGWFLRSHKGQMLISHGGSINGFWCTQYFMPRHRLGVVALSNCDEGRNGAPVIISLTLFDRLLGLEPTDWNALMTESYAEVAAAEKKAKEELLAGRVPGAQPAHPLDAYVGEYEHPGYGHLSIRLGETSLQMVMNNKKTFALALAHGNIFDAHEPDWNDHLKLTFIAGAQGHIGSLSIPLEEAVAEIIFIRQAGTERAEIAQLCERQILGTAAGLFGTSQEALGKFDDYEGCANLVYHYENAGQPRILRLSYRPDRSVELIRAELHFVEYLAAGGVRVSRPVPSVNGNLVEVIPTAGRNFIATSFIRGRGMRVPDNDYRYREGVPIQEYFQNWGQVLGQMHRLAKTYQPLSESIKRPEWHQWEYYSGFPYGEQLPLIQKKYDLLIAELHALPQDANSYGLIHNDFNDGNFTVDYDNGDITVFDFDDCCYFWFMYDIACAWEGGIGRAMFRPLKERKDFMARYMEHIMTGYTRENSLSEAWLARLPLFLRLIQMQELMHFAQYLYDPDEEIQAGLRYKIHCIENDIPYLGFFDSVFSPERPFEL